jgi:hypothetical protein
MRVASTFLVAAPVVLDFHLSTIIVNMEIMWGPQLNLYLMGVNAHGS